MMRLVTLVVLILAGSIGKAEAAIINFEDIAQAPGTETQFLFPTDPVSGGFLFDAQNHSHVANRLWGTDNGSTFLVLDEFLGPDALTVSRVGGGAFSLSAIDISEAHEIPFFAARQVQITGNLAGGGTVTQTLALDNNLVNGVYANYFQTFNLGPGFNNLQSFTLVGMGALAGTGSNYYAIDNLVVGQAVPEPGTLSLLGLGSAYLFGRRRKTATR